METATELFPNEPLSHWLPDDFDRLLGWMRERRASDVSLVPNQSVWVRIDGRWRTVSRRALSSDEIFGLIDATSRNAGASARIKGGEDLDFAYEVSVSRLERYRFRANATGCRDGWGFGANLVMRSIAALPPRIEELGLEPEIEQLLYPGNGLVLITGVMGTGKSTLLAAALRHIIEEQGGRFVVTYEAPIEFDLTAIENPKGPVVQTEVPSHFADFINAPRNCARRAVDVALVGESRDRETLRALIENAEIGMAAYSTVHTRTAFDAPARIINVYPHEEQAGICATLIASLRLIVQQRLLPRADGEGRVALREYVAFDADARRELMRIPPQQVTTAVRELMRHHGRDLLESAQAAYALGQIDDLALQALVREREENSEPPESGSAFAPH